VRVLEKSLIINPGSTSTKIAVFSGEEEEWSKTLDHSRDDIDEFNEIIDQLSWRQELILEACKKAGYELEKFDFFVARGGLLDPIPGGTYLVGEEIVKDLMAGKNGEHASNLAAIIAYNFANKVNAKAFIVDPVAVDEFKAVARLSGLPEIPRKCQSHALNLKAVGRKVAAELGENFEDINQIGVHLGGGISIAALEYGKIIDVNNANQGGPYSPERVGTLPALDLVNYIFENKPGQSEFKKELVGKGGLTAYLGTADGREIEDRISSGDEKAKLVYEGMVYQIGKEIGAMSAVLKGNVNGIFLTGGLANSEYLTDAIEEMVSYLAPVFIYPGAEEMEDLASGGLRVIRGEEEAKDYKTERL